MSIYGKWQAATILSGQLISVEVDLGRDYDFLEIIIPTLDDPTTIKLETAEKTGGDFLPLGDGVTTAAGTHNYHDVFNLGGWQFIKVVADNTQTGNKLIRVRGMRY